MSEYISLDKKYRPRLFEELVGQQTALNIVASMLYSGKLNQTIMLFGEHGTGKTTTARMIARYVNCKKNVGKEGFGEVCGRDEEPCSNCKALNNGSSPNVVEINAAEARGIGEARDLIEQAKFSPLGAARRIFIIDECYPGETLIMIDYDKAVPIKNIYENENITHVLSYDLQNKKIEKRKIINKFSRIYDDKTVKITIDNKYFSCTLKQELYVVGKGYIPANEILPGDKLISYDGFFEKGSVCEHCGVFIQSGKMSSHLMQKHRNKTTHVEYTTSNIGKPCKEETKKKISLGHIAFEKTEAGAINRKIRSEKQKGENNTIFRYMTPKEVKELSSKRFKKMWEDMDENERSWRIKTFINAPIHVDHPNNVEQTVIDWTITGLKFVGDGKFFMTLTKPDGTLWKKNPDFIYKENGKVKKIIEVMDFEYCHTKEESVLVQQLFKNIGYDCLVIDALRIKKEPTIVRGEIEAFVNNHYVEVQNVCISRNRVVNKKVYDLEVLDNHNFFVVPGTYKRDGNRCKGGCTYVGKPILSSNCQQLTPQASQAMLKPLEEPPKKSMWILCTTEPQKILSTIRGRSLQIKLNPVADKHLVQLLTKISKSEGVDLPVNALQAIAEMSQGHVRNGILMLESMLLNVSNVPKEQLTEYINNVLDEMLHRSPEAVVEHYVLALLNNSDEAFTMVRRVESVSYFIKVAVSYLKNLIFALKGLDDLTSRSFKSFISSNKFERNFGIVDITHLYEMHLNAYERSKNYELDALDLMDLVVLQCLNYTHNLDKL